MRFSFMPKSSMRSRRVADLIQHEIGLFLKKEVQDPRLMNLMITQVDVSPDLRAAKIYYTVLNKKEIENAKLALLKAKGYLRSLLAEKTRLKYIPQMEFIYDDSVARGQELSDLIDKAIRDDESRHEK